MGRFRSQILSAFPIQRNSESRLGKILQVGKIVRVLPKGSRSRDLERCVQAVFVNKAEKGCEPAAWLFCQSTMSEKLFLRQIVNRSVTMIA